MRKPGFTLLEVMALVALVGVLAVMATPLYTGRRVKARSMDAQAHVGAIRTAQLAYYENERGGAGAFAGDITALGWTLPGGGIIGKGPARYEYGTRTDGASSFGFQHWAYAVVRDARESSKVKYNLIEIDLISGAVGTAP